jgi:multiple sugar transport system ATP-binding protein
LRRIEYLGGERLFYGETEGGYPATRVIARIPATVPFAQEVGELAPFAVRAADLSLFDPQTRLARPRGGAAQVVPLRQRLA